MAKYISLENLTLYDSLLDLKIDREMAKSLKTVTISDDGKKLLFYKSSEPLTEIDRPAYEIELPEPDLSGVMPKVTSATYGNVGTFDAGGSITDSGTKLSDLATQTWVDTEIALKIDQATHLQKTIVTELPSAENAKENVIYLLKVDTVTGDDKYEEYMLIGGEIVMIGSTSTDLSDYYNKNETDERIGSSIDDAKEEILATSSQDATEKMNSAVQTSKTYTDQQIAAIQILINAINTRIDGVDQTIDGIETNIGKIDDRLTILEGSTVSVTSASEEEIKALFNDNSTPKGENSSDESGGGE